MAMAQVTDDKGRKNEIGGFWVGRVDRAVMLDFIRGFGLEVDQDGSAEQIAVGLSLHFKETTSKADMCKCTECSGESPTDLDACPFCGDSEEVEDDEDDDDSEGGDPIVEGDEHDDRASDTAIDRHGEEPPSALVSSPDLGDDALELSEAEEPPAAKPAKSPSKAKEKKSKMELVHTNGAANGASKKASTKGSTVTSLATRELDKAVAEVKKLKTEGAVSYWQLGQKILEINEKGLWKLRTTDDNKASYKSFEQFVHTELNISGNYAYSAMDVARDYTLEQVREIGSSTKAILLLKVPTVDRPKPADAKNLTTKQIRETAKASRAKHGSPKKDKHAGAVRDYSKMGAKGQAEKKASVVSDKISVTSIVGSKTIKLHQKPESMKGITASTITGMPRAKKLTDQPFGIFEMANGVVQYFSVQQKDGELVLKIETRRKDG